MPKTRVVFYQEDADTVPVLDWLDSLPSKALDKCRVRSSAFGIWDTNSVGRKRITSGTAFMSFVWGYKVGTTEYSTFSMARRLRSSRMA